jgi:hypothetical protein
VATIKGDEAEGELPDDEERRVDLGLAPHHQGLQHVVLDLLDEDVEAQHPERLGRRVGERHREAGIAPRTGPR